MKNIEIKVENLNDWAISEELFKEIIKLLPPGGTILEIGAGSGTKELRKLWTVISIEHDHRWLPPQDLPHRAIFCPIDGQTGWYNLDTLTRAIRGLKYDLIIVDGPKRTGRHGFLHNLSIFDTTCSIVVDDSHRSEIGEMVRAIRGRIGRRSEFHKADGKRGFSTFKSSREML